MKRTISYHDFPVTRQTDNLKIWTGLEIEQKGKINIGKNECVYESRLYPFKEGKQIIKVLSKIDNKTNRISFVITTGAIMSKEKKVSVKKYHELMQDLETSMINHIDIDKNNFLTGKQIKEQIAQKK